MYKCIFISESQHYLLILTLKILAFKMSRLTMNFLRKSFHLLPPTLFSFGHATFSGSNTPLRSRFILPPECFIFWDAIHFVVKGRNHFTEFYRLWMLARWCRAYKQRIQNASVFFDISNRSERETLQSA